MPLTLERNNIKKNDKQVATQQQPSTRVGAGFVFLLAALAIGFAGFGVILPFMMSAGLPFAGILGAMIPFGLGTLFCLGKAAVGIYAGGADYFSKEQPQDEHQNEVDDINRSLAISNAREQVKDNVVSVAKRDKVRHQHIKQGGLIRHLSKNNQEYVQELAEPVSKKGLRKALEEMREAEVALKKVKNEVDAEQTEIAKFQKDFEKSQKDTSNKERKMNELDKELKYAEKAFDVASRSYKVAENIRDLMDKNHLQVVEGVFTAGVGGDDNQHYVSYAAAAAASKVYNKWLSHINSDDKQLFSGNVAEHGRVIADAAARAAAAIIVGGGSNSKADAAGTKAFLDALAGFNAITLPQITANDIVAAAANVENPYVKEAFAAARAPKVHDAPTDEQLQAAITSLLDPAIKTAMDQSFAAYKSALDAHLELKKLHHNLNDAETTFGLQCAHMALEDFNLCQQNYNNAFNALQNDRQAENLNNVAESMHKLFEEVHDNAELVVLEDLFVYPIAKARTEAAAKRFEAKFDRIKDSKNNLEKQRDEVRENYDDAKKSHDTAEVKSQKNNTKMERLQKESEDLQKKLKSSQDSFDEKFKKLLVSPSVSPSSAEASSFGQKSQRFRS